MKEIRSRLAIFVDVDNLSVHTVPKILEILCKTWDVSYRRAYGINLHPHTETLRENSFIPVEVLCNSPGKNSADIALVIDAMEELCQGPSGAICIVSGDGDFTRLVQRIREKGKTAIVFGKASSPAALRLACNEFYSIEEAQPQKKEKKTPKAPVGGAAGTKRIEAEVEIRNGLERVFLEFNSECKQVALDRFGEFLKQKYPELSPARLGLRRLKPFLTRVGGFKIEPFPKGEGKPGGFLIVLPVRRPSRLPDRSRRKP